MYLEHEGVSYVIPTEDIENQHKVVGRHVAEVAYFRDRRAPRVEFFELLEQTIDPQVVHLVRFLHGDDDDLRQARHLVSTALRQRYIELLVAGAEVAGHA